MPDVDSWWWLAHDYAEETRAFTFVRESDLDVVRSAFQMSAGVVDTLTAEQARARFWSTAREGVNDLPFQIRLCPLGEWTLVVEEEQILSATVTATFRVPAVAAGTAWLEVTSTITTGVNLQYHSGAPENRDSFFGVVLGPGDGYLRTMADRIGFDDAAEDFEWEMAALVAAVAEDLGIPVVPREVLEGPLPTVYREE